MKKEYRNRKQIIYIVILVVILIGLGIVYIFKPMTMNDVTWEIIQEKVVTFSDGEWVDLWQSNMDVRDFYELSDGTLLLIAEEPRTFADFSAGGNPEFNDLNKTLQKKIRSFYDKQGLLYDIPTELERAYQKYLKCKENDMDFGGEFVRQDIYPTASNEEIICFFMIVMLPGDGEESQEICQSAIFSKDTGEVISGWDLFSVSKEEVLNHIFESEKIENEQLQEEIKKVIQPEDIVLYPKHLEIKLPQGKLSDVEYSFMISIEYEKLEGMIHEWAIPESE